MIPVPQTGLDEFKAVMADFRGMTSLAAKGAVAAPFADLLLRQFDSGIAPPWPPGILLITSVVELLSLIFIFNFFFTASPGKLNGLLLAALVVLCVSFFGYLYLFSSFTEHHPNSKQLIVLGYEPVSAEMRQSFDEGYTAREALEENEYTPAKIWTGGSITRVRIGILAGWLIAFISLSVFIGLFVIAQRRRVVAPPAEVSG